MKEYILYEDEYTTFILQQDDDDEDLEIEDLIGILGENDLMRARENEKLKRKEIIYIE